MAQIKQEKENIMRADGKRVTNVDNMYTLSPYFMVDRCDACNYITVKIPYEPVHKYILKMRKNGYKFSHMSLILAAYVRAVSMFPEVNRFVVNKKIYARNELTVAMVVQRAEEAEGTMSKIKFELTDTVFDVSKKVDEFVEGNREENSNSTDKIMSFLTKFPPIINFATTLIRWADKHGLLPKAIIDMSPFHESMVISNLASIRTGSIYHHIYNFGTVGQIITMGVLESMPKKVGDEIVNEKYIPLGIACDERIASGHMYSKVFHVIEHYLKNPELLELPPEKVVYDK